MVVAVATADMVEAVADMVVGDMVVVAADIITVAVVVAIMAVHPVAVHVAAGDVMAVMRMLAPSIWRRSLAPKRTRSTVRSTSKLAPAIMVTSARVCTIGLLTGLY